MSRVRIANGLVLDPSQGIEAVMDLTIEDGRVAELQPAGPPARPDGARTSELTIDARGLTVAPGFVDLHCHLREPGFEEKETIATGTLAAARGGFTTLCAMANTSPVADVPAVLQFVRQRAAEMPARVLPLSAVTVGQRGEDLVEMGALAEAGAVAFSDDGKPVRSSRLMRSALCYSTMVCRPVAVHAEDPELALGGAMNEGPVSTRLGLPGIPSAAEDAMVARDLALARLTGAHLHIAHVSTRGAVHMIRDAKREGILVTAEATPHHLTLTDELVAGAPLEGDTRAREPFDTCTKVNPPLRSRQDVDAVLSGLRDGTIDAIATDHAPHTLVDKQCEYAEAAFGISGLETALGVLLALARNGALSMSRLIAALTYGPAAAFGLPYGTLRVGSSADLVIFDPDEEWVVSPAEFASSGRNTPWAGVRLRGRVVATMLAGKLVFSRGESLRVWGP